MPAQHCLSQALTARNNANAGIERRVRFGIGIPTEISNQTNFRHKYRGRYVVTGEGFVLRYAG